ncbi:MAG: BrnT family toxin [Acidobacteria bacterium]|nr:BrnT family toxin [Acidobacteriota bacterium]
MSYEWDPGKAEANFRKHGIDFADATGVLEDDRALTIREPEVGEDRWVTLGMDALGRVLTVVYTWRGNNVRIISARKATARERGQYEATA